MITGHFGLAAGVKKIAPRLPLWSLLLATFWLDILFTVFSMFGLESFAPMNPARPMYGKVIINAHYTHSLFGALLISALTGWLASLRWKREGGMVIGAVVFSHWILDLLVHRPDLPILPGNLGNLPLLGFGLWEYPVVCAMIELALAVGGASLYFYSARKLKENQRGALTAGLVTGVLILLLFVVNVMGL
jgi:membrane-bound metal-dependent hydrolase YbcI (DUF457 family)